MKLNDFVSFFSMPSVAKNETKHPVATTVKTGAPRYGSDKDTTSFIAQGVVIHGPIESVNDMIIAGTVKNNVTCKGDIILQGTIDSQEVVANNLELRNATLNGNVIVANYLKISDGSVINGDITVRNVELGGCIVGKVVARESAVILNSGRVEGDLAAGSLIVVKGSLINGLVSIKAAEKSSVQANRVPVELAVK